MRVFLVFLVVWVVSGYIAYKQDKKLFLEGKDTCYGAAIWFIPFVNTIWFIVKWCSNNKTCVNIGDFFENMFTNAWWEKKWRGGKKC